MNLQIASHCTALAAFIGLFLPVTWFLCWTVTLTFTLLTFKCPGFKFSHFYFIDWFSVSSSGMFQKNLQIDVFTEKHTNRCVHSSRNGRGRGWPTTGATSARCRRWTLFLFVEKTQQGNLLDWFERNVQTVSEVGASSSLASYTDCPYTINPPLPLHCTGKSIQSALFSCFGLHLWRRQAV